MENEIRCYNCDEVFNSEDGYCEHCGYKMFGPRRDEVQSLKLNLRSANLR